jgi:hypothetical protein
VSFVKHPRELWLREAKADTSAFMCCFMCFWCLLLLVTMQWRMRSALYCLRLPHQVPVHGQILTMHPTSTILLQHKHLSRQHTNCLQQNASLRKLRVHGISTA